MKYTFIIVLVILLVCSYLIVDMMTGIVEIRTTNRLEPRVEVFGSDTVYVYRELRINIK